MPGTNKTFVTDIPEVYPCYFILSVYSVCYSSLCEEWVADETDVTDIHEVYPRYSSPSAYSVCYS